VPRVRAAGPAGGCSSAPRGIGAWPGIGIVGGRAAAGAQGELAVGEGGGDQAEDGRQDLGEQSSHGEPAG
jgi:hypothetical protein